MTTDTRTTFEEIVIHDDGRGYAVVNGTPRALTKEEVALILAAQPEIRRNSDQN